MCNTIQYFIKLALFRSKLKKLKILLYWPSTPNLCNLRFCSFYNVLQLKRLVKKASSTVWLKTWQRIVVVCGVWGKFSIIKLVVSLNRAEDFFIRNDPKILLFTLGRVEFLPGIDDCKKVGVCEQIVLTVNDDSMMWKSFALWPQFQNYFLQAVGWNKTVNLIIKFIAKSSLLAKSFMDYLGKKFFRVVII